MNPSTADEVKNDATVERMQRRAAQWGKLEFMSVGGIEVVNVFAWRATVSTRLRFRVNEGIDIIGKLNNNAILDACVGAAIVVCGWGSPGHNLLRRGQAVLNLLRNSGITPHAFHVNADGSPRHPLYLGYDVLPKRMQ